MLAKKLTPAESEMLLRLKEKLTQQIQAVKDTNDSNRLFAHSSLRWMNIALDHLKNFLTPTIYSQRGQVVQGVLPGRMVERQV